MTTAAQPATKRSRLKAKPPEEVSPGKTKALLFGASGVGKTWFALDFPSPYYVDTEGGADLRHYQTKLAKAGGVYLGPDEGSLEFASVLEQMRALASEQHPYKTLIIDSITKLFQTAIANEAEKLGDKDAFGASKKPAVAGMRALVNWAGKLDMNVLLIAHETAEWGIDPKTGQRSEVGRIADCWDKLIYELDLTLRITKSGPSRYAQVRKSRLTGFADLDSFEITDNGYAEFASRYGRDFIEAASKPLDLATPEQIAEINHMLTVVRVDEADIQKAFTRAAVDRWEDLTREQADKACKWLRSKLNPTN